MVLTQVQIPEYDGRQGNFMKGRNGTAIDTVVIHWIAGTQEVADKVFTDPRRIVSAHFSVEEDQVHQYVKIQDTAFHAGNWGYNLRSVGIEVSAQPGRDAGDQTYLTASQVVFQIAQQLGKKVSDLRFMRHGDIVATQCCGTVDVARIVQGAHDLEGDPQLAQATLAGAVKVPVKMEAHVTAPIGAKVRTTPHALADGSNWLELPVQVGGQEHLQKITFVNGQGFWYVGTERGDDIDGNATWLRLEDGHYMWSGTTDYNPNHNA